MSEDSQAKPCTIPSLSTAALDCATSSLSPCLDSAGGLVLQDDSLDSFIKLVDSFKKWTERSLVVNVLLVSQQHVLKRLLEHQIGPIPKKSKATQGWLWRLCARWMSEALQEAQSSVQSHPNGTKGHNVSFSNSSNKGTLLVHLLELIDKLPIAFSHLTAPAPSTSENGVQPETVDSLPKSIRALKKHTDPVVRDHADRVINKWRAIIDGKPSKDAKPVAAASGQKRLSAGASDADDANESSGPPAKKTAPVKTAPSQFRDTGLFPVKATDEKPPVNSSTQLKMPVRTLPPPGTKAQGTGAGGPTAAKRASLANESSAFMDALLPTTLATPNPNPAGPSQTPAGSAVPGTASARQALPAGLRVKRKVPNTTDTEGSNNATTSTASARVSSLSVTTAATSSIKPASSITSTTLNDSSNPKSGESDTKPGSDAGVATSESAAGASTVGAGGRVKKRVHWPESDASLVAVRLFERDPEEMEVAASEGDMGFAGTTARRRCRPCVSMTKKSQGVDLEQHRSIPTPLFPPILSAPA